MPEPMTIDTVNRLDRDGFVAAFGGVFEHAPWVAEAAWGRRPFRGLDDLHRVMVEAVRDAGPERQMALIRAHPDLADRRRRAGGLTAFSTAEQSAAGLDRMTDVEGDRQDRLNRDYRAKFGFPFIMAVKHSTKDEILAAMERRLANDEGTEIARALEEIGRIGRFRLEDLVAGGGS